jgi:hypothetical protein
MRTKREAKLFRSSFHCQTTYVFLFGVLSHRYVQLALYEKGYKYACIPVNYCTCTVQLAILFFELDIVWPYSTKKRLVMM